jgi:hypothetical protein
MSSPLLEHHFLVHEPSSHLSSDVNHVELALEVAQDGDAFIDELLLVPWRHDFGFNNHQPSCGIAKGHG